MTTAIDVTGIYDLIGEEDLALGADTFSRTTSDGGSQLITKIGLHTFAGGVRVVSPSVANGVTDATSTIQAAIDALSSGIVADTAAKRQGKGGVVLLPPGIYKISAPLNVIASNGAHNISIMGLGPEASVIRNVGVGTDAIRVVGSDGDSVNGFRLSDITIQGTATSGYGLFMDHVIRMWSIDRANLFNHGGGAARIENTCNRGVIVNSQFLNEDSASYRALDIVGLDLWSQVEQVWVRSVSVRGFSTGIRIARYTNVLAIDGADIAHNGLGIEVLASDDNFDSGVDTITIEKTYFEANGRDIRIGNSNASNVNFARNIIIEKNSFSQTNGFTGPYSSGSQVFYPDSPEANSILVGKAKECHIRNNVWRKIGVSADGSWPSSTRSLIRVSSVSEANEITHNSVLETVGVNSESPPRQIVLINNDGGTRNALSTPEDYGAVGDGVTDDSAALQALFDSGGGIYIPGKTYMSSKGPLIINSDFCKVQCDGTIKLMDSATRPPSDGAGQPATAIIHIRDCQGVSWTGGVLDGGTNIGPNGMAVGHNLIFRNEVGEYCYRTLISDLIIRNCIHDTTLDPGGLTPHDAGIGNGGGKGLTMQFGSPQCQVSNVRVHNCTIGASYEGGFSNETQIPDLIVDGLSVTDCMIGVHFRGLLGPSGGSDLGSDEFSSLWTNCTFTNCGVGFAPTVDDITATDFGVINAIKGTNISMVNFQIRNPSGIVTPFRGQFRNCYFEGEVDAPQLQNLADFARDKNGADPTAGETPSRHVEFRLRVKIRGAGTPGDQVVGSIIRDAGAAYLTKYCIFGISWLIGNGANDFVGKFTEITSAFFSNPDSSALDASNIWDIFDRGSGKWSKGGGTIKTTVMLT